MSAQEVGSLITYFRRYALVALLGIATEEDDDGNAASGGKVAKATPDAPERITDAAYQAYLEATQKSMEPGTLPADVMVHFGKNKGTRLGDLTPRQLAWYANDWKLQDEPTEYDHRLKQAAVALNAGDNSADFDIPFA
jgi:hypothetical protein